MLYKEPALGLVLVVNIFSYYFYSQSFRKATVMNST